TNKSSIVKLYVSFTSFFREHYPHIKLAVELEREILVGRLTNSTNFATTHFVIAKLAQFSDFSQDQIRSMLSAVATNSQISWIASDPDVSGFFLPLLNANEALLDVSDVAHLNTLLSPPEETATAEAEGSAK
ncbi:MAG TPA: hypothetical protein VLH14_00520, partial [Patescibacteria group bacterium]|nr:hypothetical protein [Patescibacteria group bacterium]